MTSVTEQALQMSWKRTPEKESLEASSENRHRGCGHDRLRQTVPSTVSSNKEGLMLMIDSCVRRTFSDTEEVERRCLRASKSAMYWRTSARYDGAVPLMCQMPFSHPINSVKAQKAMLAVMVLQWY